MFARFDELAQAVFDGRVGEKRGLALDELKGLFAHAGVLVDQRIAHDAEQAKVLRELAFPGDPFEEGHARRGRWIIERLAQSADSAIFALGSSARRTAADQASGSLSARHCSIASCTGRSAQSEGNDLQRIQRAGANDGIIGGRAANGLSTRDRLWPRRRRSVRHGR